MKLQVIGSGNIQSICNSASYLIDEEIAIDMPNGACKNLKKLNLDLSKINHVLLTHFHADHYFDIPFYFLAKYKSKCFGLNIYCDIVGKKFVRKLSKLTFFGNTTSLLKELNINYNFNNKFSINKYTVQRILMDHGYMKPAYGYIFDNNINKIGFTGDTCLCDNVIYMASVCDYLVCDCSLSIGNDKHMGINNILELAKKYPKCTFITSHMDDIVRDELKKIGQVNNIIIGYDGMLLNI